MSDQNLAPTDIRLKHYQQTFLCFGILADNSYGSKQYSHYLAKTMSFQPKWATFGWNNSLLAKIYLFWLNIGFGHFVMAEYRYWPNKKNPKYVEHLSMHSGIVISKVKLKLINMEDSELHLKSKLKTSKWELQWSKNGYDLQAGWLGKHTQELWQITILKCIFRHWRYCFFPGVFLDWRGAGRSRLVPLH